MRLANNFSAFFENKINGIYEHIDNNNNEIRHLPDIPYCKLDKFKEGTLTDMKDILSKKNEKKNCERDPFPISDIKEQSNLDKLTVIFHKITNLSLENGTFPKTEKRS